MPRPGQRIKHRRVPSRKPPKPTWFAVAEDQLAHNRLTQYLVAYLEWAAVRGLSADTVRTRRVALRRFIAWADARGIEDPREISRPILERYQTSLFHYRKSDGRPLTLATQNQCLIPLKGWFQWLTREHHILANPAADLELPRAPKRLPRALLSVAEVAALLQEAAPVTVYALRDRAILETLYATGLRRTELTQLALYDVDLNHGLLWVRQGKGGRERVVPLGSRAMAWLDKYLSEARPQLLSAATDALFLADYGQPISPEWLATKVRRYLAFAGIDKPGATHLLRHACATHMLEGGADIRFIQAMLGHATLATTEIYTHVSIDKLIAVHGATHPSRLQRRGDAQNPVTGPNLDEARQTLLEAIARDGEEETEAEALAVPADAPKAARR